MLADEDRRGAHAPAIAEGAILVGERANPGGLAVEIEGGEIAGAEEDVDELAVGCGSRHRHAAERVKIGRSRAEHFRMPQQLAVGAGVAVDVEAIVESAIGRGEEDAIVPDDRLADASALQLDFPADVFGRRPGKRQVRLIGDAAAVGAAPLRPVVGVQGSSDEKQYQASNQVFHFLLRTIGPLVPTLCVGTHCFATLLRRGIGARFRFKFCPRADAGQSSMTHVFAWHPVRDAGASRCSAFPRGAWERGAISSQSPSPSHRPRANKIPSSAPGSAPCFGTPSPAPCSCLP